MQKDKLKIVSNKAHLRVLASHIANLALNDQKNYKWKSHEKDTLLTHEREIRR